MYRHLLYLLHCACIAPSALAETPTPASRIETDTTGLDEVVVYGKSDRNKEIIPSQTLSGETLKKLNSNSVADALRYFSGVQLKDYGGVGGVKTLDVRSMGSNHMGVFYDGIQLGNAQNGQIDLGKYSLDNIESISLYNGQRSSVFQGAKDFGAAGTVYITTKRPAFSGNKSTNLHLALRSGSFGLINPSIRVEQKVNQNISASANIEYTYATGKYKFRYRRVLHDGTVAWDTTATRHNGDVKAWRGEAGLFGHTSRGHWYGKLYYYDSQRGIPGAIVNNVWKTSQRQWDKNFFGQGNWQLRLNSRWQSCMSLKYSHDYMRYLNPDTTLMYLNNRFNQNEVYASWANCVTIIPGLDANVAIDYQWNNLFSSLENFTKPERHTLLTALAASWRRGPLKAQGSVLYSYVADYSHPRFGSENLGTRKSNLSRFTPSIFVSCDIPGSRGLRLQGFYKRIFRMPTFNDLYYTDVGNSSLKPEYATQFDLGAAWDYMPSSPWARSVNISIDAYHNRVTDKIIAVPKGTGQYRWMMMNIGRVRIWGTDVTAAGQFSLPAGISCHLRLTYTWQRALDYTDPADNDAPAGTYRGQIAYIPRHSGSATAGLMWHRLSVNYSFIYVGERWHNSSNIAVNHEQPWYTSDISVSWRQPIVGLNTRFSLEVSNLLNQQYEVIQNYPMPGRNFKIILECDI